MINRSAVLAVAFGLTFPLVLGVSRTGDEADYSDGCPSLDPVVNLVDLVYGVNANECELVGSVLDLGNHVSVQIPDKGEVVGAAVDTTDGTSQVYVIATAPDGAISATVSYHDPSMLNPELAAAVAANPDGAVTLGSDIAREDSESVVLAYSRCTDNSSAATGFQWYTSATIGVWVNGTDRKPTNISSAVFASVASTVLNRWKIGADGCSLSGSPTGLDLANFGSTTRDANIANGTTTCGSRDNYNVIDWGDLPGSTYGYTCWWGSGLQTLEFDTRMDSSSRTWVTSTTGCSSAYYLAAGMMHEVGHGVGLGHATEFGGSDLTMSPSLAMCNSSAQYLGLGDFNRLMALY